MTTYFEKTVQCANCEQSSQHRVLGSTNSFGSPDLDLRPPEMQRSTMGAWLQLCPHCGYVAPDLSRPPGERSRVQEPEYRRVLEDPQFPELARRFLAYALLVDRTQPEKAARSRLQAAWACDDAELAALAVECRHQSADSYLALQPFEENDPGWTQGALLVDILRRACRFDQAAAECERLLARPEIPGILRQVLEYQRNRISARDAEAHRVEECTA